VGRHTLPAFPSRNVCRRSDKTGRHLHMGPFRNFESPPSAARRDGRVLVSKMCAISVIQCTYINLLVSLSLACSNSAISDNWLWEESQRLTETNNERGVLPLDTMRPSSQICDFQVRISSHWHRTEREAGSRYPGTRPLLIGTESEC